MNYLQTLEWMFRQLPMYQRQGNVAFKKDLTNIQAFSTHLNHPEKTFKSIHVAGTNGKGSTSHMLASVLQEAGYKVGLYTSPHLKDFRERIKINGKKVSKKFVVEFIETHQHFLQQQQLSFFEMTVAMAFQYFYEEKIDVAVIEVGLGGRLDSTNIITPELSVITNIGLDHTQFLGETLAEIAIEKAGIIKPCIPVVIGEKQAETELVFRTIAKEKQAPIFFAEAHNFVKMPSDLQGIYQEKNRQTVLQSIAVLRSLQWNISEKKLQQGLKKVVKNTGLQGRWQQLSANPKIICDTAHNKEGLRYVMQQLQEETYKKLHIVLGVVNDKKLTEITPLFPKRATYYFCKPDIPRGLSAEELRDFFETYNLHGEVYSSVKIAFDTAKKAAKPTDFIFVGGSTFTVAEII